MINKIYILITLLLAAFATASADETMVRTEFHIQFPINSSRIYPDFGDNAAQLAALDSLLNVAEPDSIRLEGWASPDGPVGLNLRLAKARRQAVQAYIVEHYPDLSLRFIEGPTGIAWQELADVVSASNEPWAESVVRIINNVPQDKRNGRLRALNGGRVWRTLIDKYYQPLRATTAAVYTIVCTEPEPEPQPEPEPHPEPVVIIQPAPVEIVEVEEVVEEPVVVVDSVVDVRPNRYFALSTNMLYDALAVPNIGFDAYVGKQWSIAGNWTYAWWHSRPKARYWRTYGGWLGARRWFGSKAEEKPLQGHHIGAYAQMLLYDFEWGGKGYLSGIPGCNIFHRPTWGFGIEYGYSMAISRRLNIDFNIGIGYLTGQYREYEPQNGHFVWLSTKNRHYFGPTKVEISLVWLLGHGNFNAKKGGEI